MTVNGSPIFIAFALLGATTAAAQNGVQLQRLVAKQLPLDAPAGASALASIWRDSLAAEREKLAASARAAPGSLIAPSAIEIPVFEASFKDGDNTVIVSALFTMPECRNFAGAAAPSLNNCPMRVAILRNGQTRNVSSEAEFPFVAALKDGPDDRLPEFDNASQRDKTVVVFNPATHEITTTLTLNGVIDTEKASPIRIAY